MSTMPRSTGATSAAARTRSGDAASSYGAVHDSGDTGKTLVDLVIAVGTDAPMLAVAQSLDSALDASVDAASKACPSSSRVTCLGVGASFGATRFTTSVSDYLAVYVQDPSDLRETPLPPGDLARAVIDLSRYFDWLPDAHRAIFLMGDIGLETSSDQAAETADAIAAARAAEVKVYTCVNMQRESDGATEAASTLQSRDIAQYMRLANQTLGAGYISTDGTQDFPWMLQKILCDIASSDKRWNGDGTNGCRGNGGAGCGGPCNCCQCEQARLIARTAGMLSMVLRRVADNCCPRGKGER